LLSSTGLLHDDLGQRIAHCQLVAKLVDFDALRQAFTKAYLTRYGREPVGVPISQGAAGPLPRPSARNSAYPA
jgi:hypothetical protein